jgi:arylsulfatase A-like enzyme
MPLSRREALKALGALAALRLDPNTLPVSQPRRAAPNIVFIMTDDQRHDALSAAGNPILRTPNIDRLATEGVRFADAFVTNALCAPSRATILTGLYSHAHGVITNGGGPQYYNQPGLPPEQTTFVDLLRSAGYHTALIGKWHLRSDPRGFDRWIVFPGQGAYHDPEMIANGVRLKLRGHADDVVGDQGLLFLRDRPRDRPFCLLFQFKSPHRSWMPAERFARTYDDIEIPLPRTFEDKLVGRPEALRRAEMAIADMPDFRDRGVDPALPPDERKRLNLQHLVKNYYRVLLSVDENVGRFLDALDREGLAENTIVIYVGQWFLPR